MSTYLSSAGLFFGHGLRTGPPNSITDERSIILHDSGKRAFRIRTLGNTGSTVHPVVERNTVEGTQELLGLKGYAEVETYIVLADAMT
ncbi:hypothetical protein GGS21DRAFT_491546 [Xylaria nigripes]|nr:hypothetical protein GGS21DRAFT_491546 [Xylaria nigripes]